MAFDIDHFDFETTPIPLNLESKSASLLKAAFESLSEGDVGNISGV